MSRTCRASIKENNYRNGRGQRKVIRKNEDHIYEMKMIGLHVQKRISEVNHIEPSDYEGCFDTGYKQTITVDCYVFERYLGTLWRLVKKYKKCNTEKEKVNHRNRRKARKLKRKYRWKEDLTEEL